LGIQSSRPPARLSEVCESQNYIIKASHFQTTILFPRPDEDDTCHNIILDSPKLFYEKKNFLLKNKKKSEN